MKKLFNWITPLPFLVTLVTSILLFINYLINISTSSLAVHLHVWFGLIFLIMITQKLSGNLKKF